MSATTGGAGDIRSSGTPLERALVSLLRRSPELLPDALPDAVREAAEILGGRDTTMLIADLGQQLLVSLDDAARHEPIDGSPAGEAFKQERPMFEQTGSAAQLWMPILDSAERVGVLHTIVPEVDEDVLFRWSMLAGLIGELVVAKTRYGDFLDNARRVRPLTVAAEMRWALMPPLTFTSKSIVVAGAVQPAYAIAGDTFDYSVSQTQADVALFDAMGHGLEASRIANLAVSTYRNGRRRREELTANVRCIDETIQEQFGESRFVTAQLAQIDIESGVITAVNAGHPSPAVFHADGTFEELPSARSYPIGLDAAPRATQSSQLLPGDVVLLHTDGVTEARADDGEFFGGRRLRQMVSDLMQSGLRPAEVLRQVILALHDFQPQLRDDATLVLVGWRVGEDAIPPVART